MRGERAASSPERPEGPFWRYSPASKARGVSGLGNGRHPAITDEREERERVSRYRVVARRTWVCATVSWLRLADRLGWGGTISLDPAEGGWPTDGQHVNVRRQAKHGQARGAGRGLVRRVVVRPPRTGRATAPRSHRAPGQSCLHECTSHGATACIVHVPIDGDIRYGYVVSYDATANSSGQRRATPTPTNRPHAHGWTGAARRKTGP